MAIAVSTLNTWAGRPLQSLSPLCAGRGDGFKLKGVAIAKRSQVVLPRVIRLRDAPGYVGMDKNRFGVEVRPYVREARIGERGIAFDRLELDDWVDSYFERNARAPEPPKRSAQELSDWVAERLDQKSKDAFEKTLARKKPRDC